MKYSKTLFLFTLLIITACSRPVSGPDKSLGGAVLGGAWGAGAGAVAGNQVGDLGPGAAVGAAVGAVGGIMSGASQDLVESGQLKQQNQLKALRINNLSNERTLARLQDKLDRAAVSGLNAIYQVFFDADSSTLKSGSIANLEIIADSLRTSPKAAKIKVVGHSDDAGTPEYNEKIAESRARSVASYLMARGLAGDQIFVQSYGSQRPIASNTTESGQQLNRRVDIYIGN